MARARNGVTATFYTLYFNIMIIGVNIATGTINARTLGPTGRGEQAAMIMWPQFLAYIVAVGLPASLIYNIKRHPEQSRQLFSAALWMGLILGSISSAIGVFLLPHWLGKYPAPVVHFAQWTMVLMPIATLTEIAIATYRAREEFSLYNRLRFLPPAMTLVGLITLVVVHKMTPFSAALVTHACCTFTGILLISHLIRVYRPNTSRFVESARRLLRYSLRIFGSDVLIAVSQQLDQVLVVGFLSPNSMGIYVVALSLSRMLNVFQTAAVSVLFPKTAGKPTVEVIAITGRAVRMTMALSIGVGLSLMVLAKPALILVYGAEFASALPVFWILVIEAIISGAISILIQAFMALERPGIVTVFQAAGLGLSLPLMLVLIPRYGVIGAGLALLVSTSCRMVLVLVSFPLFLKTSPPQLVFARGDFALLKTSLGLEGN